MIVDEATKELNSGEILEMLEGGKKDPLIRRQELLVKSGLAEVCFLKIKHIILDSVTWTLCSSPSTYV